MAAGLQERIKIMGIFEKKQPAEPSAFSLELPAVGKGIAYLGKNLKIDGKISGQDHIQVHGDYKGEMELEVGVIIESTGHVRGNLKAKHITIGGDFDGNLNATDRIEVQHTATVKGNLKTPVIAVQQGSVFEGHVQMKDGNPND